jgi:hypothetical protein
VSEKEILVLEDKRFGAMIGRDFKALEAMVHDDLLYTQSAGLNSARIRRTLRPSCMCFTIF